MQLSRRDFLVAGAALVGGSMLGGLSACAGTVPRAQSLVPGVARVDLGGGVTVTAISDGYGSRAVDAAFVRNAALSEVQAALAEAGLPTDRLAIPYTVQLVDIGGQRVLFDTGNGEFGAATAGKVLENMTRAGIDPASVTAVVISHFHGDHINGLRNKAGQLVYPNAKVFVPAPEWAWWMDDARMAAAPAAMQGAYAAPRRVFGPMAANVVRFEPGSEVLPGVASVAAHGHTPGHTAFIVAGGDRKLMLWGDNTNVAALFVRHPDWSVAFDLDAEVARATRRRLAEQVLAQRLLLAGYHLPGAAIGTLVRRGDGYDFLPLSA
ncbi:MBL fold metallo-hydrolase [Propionivibrio dicarboxylicus]|uniref:Glyoxylase, beta-lactamase superfamily II n=1 Tax=Propionivibrio dicarboxylicus TaxID=83767 RepID=A0A1G8BX12_9RHOO|nr:MBL fold metallo-hydrolase [Propionivibrio dicarboxylicus]SDH37613.1 Glyoxylase, beta-lactamase superfamily II [Propionivibrio dicarboxylicus]